MVHHCHSNRFAACKKGLPWHKENYVQLLKMLMISRGASTNMMANAVSRSTATEVATAGALHTELLSGHRVLTNFV